ncbi:MAG: sensor histidine kinase [Lachnospirales bacterium]
MKLHNKLKSKYLKLNNSIGTKIFASYGLIFSLLIIFISILYYFISYNGFLENHTNSSKQISKIISTQVNQYFESLNKIQKRMLESNEILEYIFEEDLYKNAISTRSFIDNIYTIVGYDFEFYHMNIFNLKDDYLISFGQNYSNKPYNIPPQIYKDIVKPTINLSGAKNIIPTNEANIYSPNEDTETLSICRAFGRYPLSTPRAIIEIQVDLKYINKLVTDYLVPYDHIKAQVLIFNKNNQLIYPSNFLYKDLEYYSTLDTKDKSMFINPFTNETEIITSYYSKDIGFTTMLITPESFIVQNKSSIKNTVLLFCLIAFALLLFITYRIAKSITSPLADLKNKISNFALEDISYKEFNYIQNEAYNEVEMLNEAYNHMQSRLKKSLEDIVASKTYAVHSQIMALQAQIDSHFLYNTLTIIAIIAEENEDLEVSNMCTSLIEMLRYIQNDYSESTTFAEEIHHSQNYTKLMSIKFGNKIKFNYNIDSSLSSLKIPRLIIQPIIENCVKYSRSDNKTLEISINSYLDNNYWFVEITDNGDGFSKNSLNDIKAKISDLDENKDNLSIDLSGLGLANIYLRLKLYYSNNFIFDIKNIDLQNLICGASIKIGGLYKNEKF